MLRVWKLWSYGDQRIILHDIFVHNGLLLEKLKHKILAIWKQLRADMKVPV